MAEKKMTVSALVKEVERGAGHWTVDEHSDFADRLAIELRARGWKSYRTYSYCKVASSEYHLAKGELTVEIIAASFLGPFVQVHCQAS